MHSRHEEEAAIRATDPSDIAFSELEIALSDTWDEFLAWVDDQVGHLELSEIRENDDRERTFYSSGKPGSMAYPIQVICKRKNGTRVTFGFDLVADWLHPQAMAVRSPNAGLTWDTSLFPVEAGGQKESKIAHPLAVLRDARYWVLFAKRRAAPSIPEQVRSSISVFLCHGSDDKQAAQSLYELFLKVAGIDPWLDTHKLLPGQDWDSEIKKAIQKSDVVVVCLSRKSITREGYVQKEIKHALDVADEKPEDRIFVIPARLEECDVPTRLRKWQWVDLFAESGFHKLLSAVQSRGPH